MTQRVSRSISPFQLKAHNSNCVSKLRLVESFLPRLLIFDEAVMYKLTVTGELGNSGWNNKRRRFYMIEPSPAAWDRI